MAFLASHTLLSVSPTRNILVAVAPAALRSLTAGRLDEMSLAP